MREGKRFFKIARRVILLLLFFAAAMEWQGIPFHGGCAHLSAEGTARRRPPLLLDQENRAGHVPDDALVVAVEKVAFQVSLRVGRHE